MEKNVEIQKSSAGKGLRIGMVHQHFMLAEPVSALDNVFIEFIQRQASLVAKLRQKVLIELEQI